MKHKLATGPTAPSHFDLAAARPELLIVWAISSANASLVAKPFNRWYNLSPTNTKPYIMPEERTINIDEPVDLKLAELMIFERSI